MTKYPFIPVNIPLVDGNEKKYLNECIDTGWISSEGPFVKQFEDQFANRVQRKYAIAVTNGTAALDVGIEALGIGPGDEVILPAFTIISCIGQIIRSGATPVLVDSDPLTWNMNLKQVEEKITEHTKAIMVVHIFGLPVDIEPLLEIAKNNNIKIIEDAAEMHGQTYNGNPCGSFGDISTFSFYPNKHITTGEGGMIVTNDAQLAEDCRSLRNLCFQPEKRFVHERFGWNYRMTNIQATLGISQLSRIKKNHPDIKTTIPNTYGLLVSKDESGKSPIPQGLKPWDTIIGINDTLINNDVEFSDQLIKYKIGQVITVNVLRDKRFMKVNDIILKILPVPTKLMYGKLLQPPVELPKE